MLFLWRGLTTDGFYDPANTLLGHFPWRGEVAMPARADMNPLLTDQPTQFLVWRHFASGEIRRGRLPVWNPWAGSGRPLLANSQSAVFSPYNLGHYAFGERAGALWSAATRLLSAALGMWLLARRLGMREAGAAFAAVSFAFSAPLIIGLGHPHGAGYTALPWLLCATHALVTAPGPGAAAGTACAVALAFVTGHPETTFHMLVGAILWGGWLLWRVAGRPRRTLGWGLVGVLVGLMLAAPHWLPFLEYLAHSHAWTTRGASGLQFADPVPALGLLAWFLPNLFGHPQAERFWLDGTNFQAISGYAGLATPLLALWGLRPRSWPPAVRGLAVVALVALLAVYGCPPLPWIMRRLPLFRAAMNERLLVVGLAGLVILGGWAVDALGRRPPARRVWVVCALAGLALALAGHFGRARPDLLRTLRPALVRAGTVLGGGGALLAAGAGPWGLVAVAAADLGTWGYRFNPVSAPEAHYPVTPFIRALQAELAGHSQRRLLARGYVFPAETPLRYGMRDVKGYDAVESARYMRYMEIAMRTGRGTGAAAAAHRRLPLMTTYRSRLLDAAGAAVVVSEAPLSHAGLTLLAEAPGVFAYRNVRALPRARLAHGVVALPSADAVAQSLARPGHDPATVTFVEGPPASVSGLTGDGGGRVKFLVDEPTRVQLSVEADGPALLVLADLLYPGWAAAVDGDLVAILPADLAFRAVPVPKGAHVVEFRYRSRSLEAGLVLAALAFGLVAVFAARGVRSRRSRSPAQA